jgi:hypothetical protein
MGRDRRGRFDGFRMNKGIVVRSSGQLANRGLHREVRDAPVMHRAISSDSGRHRLKKTLILRVTEM